MTENFPWIVPFQIWVSEIPVKLNRILKIRSTSLGMKICSINLPSKPSCRHQLDHLTSSNGHHQGVRRQFWVNQVQELATVLPQLCALSPPAILHIQPFNITSLLARTFCHARPRTNLPWLSFQERSIQEILRFEHTKEK